MNVKIYKDVKNKINRAMNCDNANIEKQIRTAERQIAAVELIERTIGLSSSERGAEGDGGDTNRKPRYDFKGAFTAVQSAFVPFGSEPQACKSLRKSPRGLKKNKPERREYR